MKGPCEIGATGTGMQQWRDSETGTSMGTTTAKRIWRSWHSETGRRWGKHLKVYEDYVKTYKFFCQ